ncbi:MAG: acetyltransferase [Magnetospirillum sp.]|nr:acetyltransferase [Magnetospirillum sp.]
MDQTVFGLFGAGGLAREVMPVVRAALGADHILVFVDRHPGPAIHGHGVLDEAAFFALPGRKFYAAALSDGQVRAAITERCLRHGAAPVTIRAANAEVMDGSVVAPGALLCSQSMVTVDAVVGRSFICDRQAFVSHDCVIGDFVTFGPGVKCSGNVTVEDFVYVGAGAMIRQGLRIGRGAVVGMGAVVVKDVPPGAVVAGNPARPLHG